MPTRSLVLRESRSTPTGQAHTIDAGYLCRVGGDTPNSAAHMAYDEKTRVLHFYAIIGGKPVPLSNTDEPCDRTLSLAQQ